MRSGGLTGGDACRGSAPARRLGSYIAPSAESAHDAYHQRSSIESVLEADFRACSRRPQSKTGYNRFEKQVLSPCLAAREHAHALQFGALRAHERRDLVGSVALPQFALVLLPRRPSKVRPSVSGCAGILLGPASVQLQVSPRVSCSAMGLRCQPCSCRFTGAPACRRRRRRRRRRPSSACRGRPPRHRPRAQPSAPPCSIYRCHNRNMPMSR